MGAVTETKTLGGMVQTLKFDCYEDFVAYNKFLEDEEKDFTSSFTSSHNLSLSKEEFYYLSCILGHLVPAGKVSKSLLDKVSTYDLDCKDFDLVKFKGNDIGGYSITIYEDEE